MMPALADNDVLLLTLFLIAWLIFCIRMKK